MLIDNIHNSNNLRVLHVIASVARETGGPVEGLTQSVRYRLQHGQYIEVVTLDDKNASFLSDFPCKVTGVGPALKRYGYTPKLAEWIVENKEHFDVAVIHGLWNHASVGGWQGCTQAGLPYVLFTHGMMDPWFKKAYLVKHWLKQLFWLIQGRVLRDASEVLFTSAEEKRLADGVFWGYEYTPKVVAYAAADAPEIHSDDDALFRKTVPNLHDCPFLLYLSRIHEKKGCDLLLEGFAKAVQRPDLQLVMAGPCHDDLIDRLKAQAQQLGIADRVHWAGMLKGAAKAGAFRAAEAFVLTSHQENFGIAVAEALAYGKPVLISNQINIWREIETGGGGIAADDTVEGATQVLQTWENMTAEQRVEMGLIARQVYERNFTVAAAARDLTIALQYAVTSKKD
ncbi:glycosyltransferase [Acinetobacter soli]|uniref:glycosyltransferase n=1 Tax=Acinetobacter soli TaxID=487316 RepID=UPI001C075749|nr:glycosyltransferase [Acinetobacter soli]